MFNYIIRFFNATWYTITGRAREEGDNLLMQNPSAVHQAYEDIINDKRKNMQLYKESMGQLLAIREQNKNSLQKLNEEIDAIKDKIADLLEHRILLEDKYKKDEESQETNVSDAELNQHPVNIIFVHLVTTLEEKNLCVAKLTREKQRAEEDFESYKQEVVRLRRNVEKLTSEQAEVVDDLFTVHQIQDIAEMVPNNKVD